MLPENFWLYVMAGVAGGLVRSLLVRHNGILLPRLVRLKGHHTVLDLGFLGSVCLGVGASILVDHSWQVAMASAIAGPHLLEEIVARITGVVQKPAPPAAPP